MGLQSHRLLAVFMGRKRWGCSLIGSGGVFEAKNDAAGGGDGEGEPISPTSWSDDATLDCSLGNLREALACHGEDLDDAIAFVLGERKHASVAELKEIVNLTKTAQAQGPRLGIPKSDEQNANKQLCRNMGGMRMRLPELCSKLREWGYTYDHY